MEWGLTMTQRETEAIIEMLDTCEEPVEVEAKGAEGTNMSKEEPESNDKMRTTPCTGRVRKRRKPGCQGCWEALAVGEDFRRKWSSVPEMGTEMVLCVSVEQRGLP